MARQPKSAAAKPNGKLTPEPTAISQPVPELNPEPELKVDGLAAPAPAPSTSSSQAESNQNKILLFEREGGGIDLAKMQNKNRERFLAWVRKTPELFPEAPTQPLAAGIPDEAVSVFFNLVGIGETVLASKKFPPEIAAAVFMWNRKQVEQIKEPAKNLAAKYLPAMAKWKEETAFISVFADIHFEKMALLRQLMAEHTAAVLAAQRTPGPKAGDNKGGMPGEVSPADPAPVQ